MSIMTGPYIKALATPVVAHRLAVGEYVWRNGEPMLVWGNHPAHDNMYLTLKAQDGTLSESFVPFDMEMTRCGPNGERIAIDPFDPKWCGPASYDFHLGDTIKVYDTFSAGGSSPIFDHHIVIDPKAPPGVIDYLPMGDGYPDSSGGWYLNPGRVYLASIRERISVHMVAAQVGGRSSWGRYGLFVHVTAGYVDPGWGRDEAGEDDGVSVLTLELVPTQPIIVRPGDRIGQLVFSTIVGEYQSYKGRYRGDTGPAASRFHLGEGA